MKIARSFRFDSIVNDRLDRLVTFYNGQPNLVSMPGSNKVVNRTDILEFLITSKFDELILRGQDL